MRHHRPQRPIEAIVALLGVAIALGVLLPVSASASALQEVGSFGCGSGTAGNLSKCEGKTMADGQPDEESLVPGRIALDEASGELYVIDYADDAIDEFSTSGQFLGQIHGSSTTAGSFGFAPWTQIDDIAVDNSGGAHAGWIYVASEQNTPGMVYAFDSTGQFQWQSQEGISDVCGIAVDSAGGLWIGDYSNGVQLRDPATGAPANAPVFNPGNPCQIAFDRQGNVLVQAYGTFSIDKYSLAVGHLGELLSSYEPRYTDGGGSHPMFSMDFTVDAFDDSTYATGQGTFKWDAFGNPPDGEAVGGPATGIAIDSESHTLYVGAAVDGSAGSIVIYSTLSHELTVGVSGNGVVSCDGSACNGGNYSAGSEVTVEAQAASGYFLAGWLGCPSSSSTSCVVTMNQDTNVTAVFMPSIGITPEAPGEHCAQGGVKVESAGETYYVCSGEAGEKGSSGSSGQNGGNGKDGAPGGQGPEGRQGPAGPSGKVTCAVKKKGAKVKVTCIVKQNASSSRVQWSLMRAGRAYRHGVARQGRVRLGILPPGHYRLWVQGQGAATELIVH